MLHKKKYIIVKNEDEKTFVQDVTTKLNQGYKCCGGVQIYYYKKRSVTMRYLGIDPDFTGRVYMQAMEKMESKNEI